MSAVTPAQHGGGWEADCHCPQEKGEELVVLFAAQHVEDTAYLGRVLVENANLGAKGASGHGKPLFKL